MQSYLIEYCLCYHLQNGEIDASGECCEYPDILDACGVCGGAAKSVDMSATCCPGPLDASGSCCTAGWLDGCGVCAGDGTSCALHLPFQLQIIDMTNMQVPGSTQVE